jgi:hypothetical protein
MTVRHVTAKDWLRFKVHMLVADGELPIRARPVPGEESPPVPASLTSRPMSWAWRETENADAPLVLVGGTPAGLAVVSGAYRVGLLRVRKSSQARFTGGFADEPFEHDAARFPLN